MESLVFMIYAVCILFCFLVVDIPIYKKHKKATCGIVNYDPSMRKFVYKVYMSREEIISSLKIMNVKDELSCSFDYENNIVLIKDLGSLTERKKYYYEIQECEGYSILKLSRVSYTKNYPYTSRPFMDKNKIPYKLNPFMVSKVNAEIIPFSQYGN